MHIKLSIRSVVVCATVAWLASCDVASSSEPASLSQAQTVPASEVIPRKLIVNTENGKIVFQLSNDNENWHDFELGAYEREEYSGVLYIRINNPGRKKLYLLTQHRYGLYWNEQAREWDLSAAKNANVPLPSVPWRK